MTEINATQKNKLKYVFSVDLDSEPVKFRVYIYEKNNYEVKFLIHVPNKCDEPGVAVQLAYEYKSVALSTEDLENLSEERIANFNENHKELSLWEEVDGIDFRLDGNVYLVKRDAWNRLVKSAGDFLRDRNRLGGHRDRNVKPTLRAGEDARALRQLLIAYAQYYYRLVFGSRLETVCEEHGKEFEENGHEKTCTKGNKDTCCYELSKRSLVLITLNNLDGLSTILSANGLGQLHLGTKEIVGDSYEDAVEEIHSEAFYALSMAMVFNAQSLLPQYDERAGGTRLPCIKCVMTKRKKNKKL